MLRKNVLLRMTSIRVVVFYCCHPITRNMTLREGEESFTKAQHKMKIIFNGESVKASLVATKHEYMQLEMSIKITDPWRGNAETS